MHGAQELRPGRTRREETTSRASIECGAESAMAAKKDILSFIDAGREVRRAPLVGMQFLHERAVRPSDVIGTRAGLKAKDLIGLLLGHFTGTPRSALPRRRTVLRVFTPAGRPAVKIRHK